MKEETALALSMFDAYCALGDDRSLVKLREHLIAAKAKRVPALKTLKDWSAAHKWQDRVKAYELAEAERKRKKRELEIEAMNERHALMAVNYQRQMLERIKVLIEQDRFGAFSATTLLKIAVDLERVARGEVTEIANMKFSGDAEHPLVIKTVWDRALLQLPEQKEETHGATEAESAATE